mgnify:CR=1 FL=1|jgi:hypothetical protein
MAASDYDELFDVSDEELEMMDEVPDDIDIDLQDEMDDE